MENVHQRALAALMLADPEAKGRVVCEVWEDWQQGLTPAEPGEDILAPVVEPGRPPRPELVEPTRVPRRGLGSARGRAALIHALCHIEFNAINLALDCVHRFRSLPGDFHGGWLQVAAEEVLHFRLLRGHLQGLGHDYGDFPAHGGLWQMAVRTAHDPLVRMAMVPRTMEARGLDVTPGIMEKLREAGDLAAVGILEVVLRDEVGHVALGDRWYRHLCAQRGLDAENRFRQLLGQYRAPRLARPFNHAARAQAGFSAEEMAALEQAAA